MSDHDRARKLSLWVDFCAAHRVAERSVPLFACDSSGCVLAEPYGRNGRLVLRRSPEMEALLVEAGDRVIHAHREGRREIEGVLYMMIRLDAGQVTPLYIGRTGMFGVNGGLSANLKGIHTDRGKFARWGSNYAYHIGDLSAAACPGHPEGKRVRKYQRWAERLFVEVPSPRPRLRAEVRFWATVWGPETRSIWREYGRTSLAFEEYLLIGVASDLFPNDLLNDEGVNRRAASDAGDDLPPVPDVLTS